VIYIRQHPRGCCLFSDKPISHIATASTSQLTLELVDKVAFCEKLSRIEKTTFMFSPMRKALAFVFLLATGATSMAFDLVTPVMTDDKPGPGKRVRQVSPEYQGTEVYHALYLPRDWQPGGKYPVIVEYTGNKHGVSGSTGEVQDANLGYGLSGGRGFIWVSMPYVEKGRRTHALHWWGDRQASIDYCKVNLPRICAQFGGDPAKMLICGFSRGAIGASYLGLADDEIASLWIGMVTHDHFDGQMENWPYPECDRASALKRLGRLRGRPVLVCGMGADYLRENSGISRFTFLEVPVAELFEIPEGKVIHPHTDLWMHKESKYRTQAREWLAEVIKSGGPQSGAGPSAHRPKAKSDDRDKRQLDAEKSSR
jgi:hypothetical protein